MFARDRREFAASKRHRSLFARPVDVQTPVGPEERHPAGEPPDVGPVALTCRHRLVIGQIIP
jgi:hypothetical protein